MTPKPPAIRLWLLLGAITAAAPAAGAAGQTLDYTQAVDLVSQAKDLFRQANELAAKDPQKANDLYQKSVMRFERVAQQGGIHNGKLYYNIANTYFRIGDLGRAILYYRRAQLIMPGDTNLRQNLSYARSKRIDKIPQAQQTRILKTLFFWHYDLSLKTRLSLFVVFFAAVWTCASIRLFKRRSAINWALGISVILAVIFLGSLCAQAVIQHRNVQGVILAPEVIARKGNAQTYQPSFEQPLHAGTEFKLLEDRSGWYNIELPDGRTCWVQSKTTGLIR